MVCAGSWACLSRCAEDGKTAEVPYERLRTAAVRARGEQLYRDFCVLCHGENADGRGARSMGLDRKPANFTDPVWRRPESAARAFQAITQGVPGSAMPPWANALSDDDRWALVAFLTSVSERTAPDVPAER
jgi:mono/diheme cytochrome c family protein